MPKPVDNRQIREAAFRQREEGRRHQSMEVDLLPYQLIQSGDLRAVDVMREQQKTVAPMSRTSADPLRHSKYLFVTATTLAGRAAISAGMDPERANIASDLFIQRADQMTEIPQVESFMLEMVRFYAAEVAGLDRGRVGSKRVLQALGYIDSHLYQRVTEDEIAESISLSRAYFATLFKKETGMSVSACIRQRKVREAEALLRATDMTASEISQLLAFSSQSHFVRVFREETGTTPGRFRAIRA